jgi:hypothetical protein
MGKKASYKLQNLPAFEPPFVVHTAELIASPAWRARSIHVVRLLNRLELENCAHAGRENGFLVVSYEQFVKAGIGKQYIKNAIEDAVVLGLLVVDQGRWRGGAKGLPNKFGLTYLPLKTVPLDGTPPYHILPTNEWRRYRPGTLPKRSSKKSFPMVTPCNRPGFRRGNQIHQPNVIDLAKIQAESAS